MNISSAISRLAFFFSLFLGLLVGFVLGFVGCGFFFLEVIFYKLLFLCLICCGRTLHCWSV